MQYTVQVENEGQNSSRHDSESLFVLQPGTITVHKRQSKSESQPEARPRAVRSPGQLVAVNVFSITQWRLGGCARIAAASLQKKGNLSAEAKCLRLYARLPWYGQPWVLGALTPVVEMSFRCLVRRYWPSNTV